MTLPRRLCTSQHPDAPATGSTTGTNRSRTLEAMDALADTPTLLSWLLNVLVVATGIAAAAVVLCAVVVVSARLRSNDPVATAPARTSDAPEAIVSGTRVSTGTRGQHRDRVSTGTGAAQRADIPVDEPERPQLPVGAETALNAIVELRPDPRNVVVTHRDPTGEVRLYPLTESPPDADSDRFERSA